MVIFSIMQDKNKLFLDKLLEDAKLTRAELSRKTGISQRQISNWNNNGVPRWAVAYLKLEVKYNKLLAKFLDED